MTGDPLQEREHDSTPLPPIVGARGSDRLADDALNGAPLPPFHRGLAPVRWEAAAPDAEPAGEAGPAGTWNAEAEREAIDSWEARRAAWDAEFAPAEEEAADEVLTSPPWGAPEAAAAETETGLDGAAPTLKPWGGEEEPAAFDGGPAAVEDLEPAPFDVGPSGAEDIVSGEPPWAEEIEPEAAPWDTQAAAEPGPEPAAWEAGAAVEPETQAAVEPEAEAPAEPFAEAAAGNEQEVAPWEEPAAEDGWARAAEESDAAATEPEPVAPGWDDSWTGDEAAAAVERPAGEHEPSAEAGPSEIGGLPQTGDDAGERLEAEEAAPHDAGDEGVDDWLAGGVSRAFPWDDAAEEAAMTSDATFGGEAPSFDAVPPAEAAADEPPVWASWEPEDDATPLPVEPEAEAWTLDNAAFVRAAGYEAVEDDLAATHGIAPPEAGQEASPEAGQDASPEAGQETLPVGEPDAGELVARMPPTPVDAWYHAATDAGANEAWEAFGRALEEAASWGDLGSTIATGLPPEQREPAAAEEEAGEPAVEEEAGERTAAAGPEAAEPATAAPEPSALAVAGIPGSGSVTRAADSPLEELASRLEEFAQRLRAEGGKGVETALTQGDRLEASLAAFIAGYVAARRE